MTAVTRPAEARRRASRMMKSSIRCSLTGGLVGWITKTSWPRIESSILTLISPSGKWRRRGVGERDAELVGDALGELGVGGAGDQLERAPGRRLLAGELHCGCQSSYHSCSFSTLRAGALRFCPTD